MTRLVKTTVLLAVTCLVPVLVLHAQQPPPSGQPRGPAAKGFEKGEFPKAATDPIIEKIKEEGLKRSQVMTTLSYLSDVIGPRLTGSPNMKRANEWTRDKLTAWGMANAHLEAWGPFGRGWSLKRFSAQVIEPQCIPLIGFPKAWSPGTDGTLVAPVVYFDAKSEAEFAKYKGKLKGAIVLASPIREVAARFEPLARRLTDSELLALADAAEPNARWFPSPGPGGGSTRRCPNGRRRVITLRAAGPGRMGRFNSPEMRAQMELARKKTMFLVEEGAAMLVESSTQGDGGTFFVQSATIPGAPLPGMGGGGGGGQVKDHRPSESTTRTHPRSLPRSFCPRNTTTAWPGWPRRVNTSRWWSTSQSSSTTMT